MIRRIVLDSVLLLTAPFFVLEIDKWSLIDFNWRSLTVLELQLIDKFGRIVAMVGER